MGSTLFLRNTVLSWRAALDKRRDRSFPHCYSGHGKIVRLLLITTA
jgi:hypothetical protein